VHLPELALLGGGLCGLSGKLREAVKAQWKILEVDLGPDALNALALDLPNRLRELLAERALEIREHLNGDLGRDVFRDGSPGQQHQSRNQPEPSHLRASLVQAGGHSRARKFSSTIKSLVPSARWWLTETSRPIWWSPAKAQAAIDSIMEGLIQPPFGIQSRHGRQ